MRNVIIVLALTACNADKSDTGDGTATGTATGAATGSATGTATGTATGSAPIDADNDGSTADVDCDDADPSRHPGAAEVCDGIDQDCDNEPDDGLIASWWVDADLDGYGDPGIAPIDDCAPVLERVTLDGDCDDADPLVNPGETEVCDTRDEDCSGTPDDGLPTTTWYLDDDADGYGAGAPLVSCQTELDRYVTDDTDCDDARSDVNPGAVEVGCTGIDEDCAGGDAPGDHLVPTQYGTVQAAVSAAAPGDTVCIADGDYSGIVVVNKDLNLVGTGPNVRFTTGNGSRVYVAAAGHQRLVNVRLDGRDMEPLIQVSPGATLELTDVTAEDVGCDMFCLGLVAYVYATGQLEVRRFHLEDTVVGDPAKSLGALFYGELDAPIRIEDTHFVGHDIRTATGSFLINGDALSAIRRVTFTDIFAAPAGDFSLVGWVRGSIEELLLQTNTISGAGYVVGVGIGPDTEVVRLGVIGNEITAATDASAVRTYGVATIENALLAGNHIDAPATAAALLADTDVSLQNVTVADNDGSGAPLIGADLRGDSTVVNAIFSGDLGTAEVRSVGILTLDAVDFWGPSTPIVDGSDNPIGWYGLTADPMFASGPAGYGYTLSPGSACIDAGLATVRDADGTPSDLGAFGGPRAVIP